jgi:hypothetical protein
MVTPVTVITATISGRETMLGRCLASIYAQTVPVEMQLVCARRPVPGVVPPVDCSLKQNALLPAVTTEWVLRISDDDELLPHHVETVLPYLTDQADVVYSFCASGNRPCIDCNDWPQAQLVKSLESANFIADCGVCTRTEVLRSVGGWPTEWEGGSHLAGGHFKGSVANFEDWACWLALARAGARFVCVPVPTWVYNDGPHPRISTVGYLPT